MYRMLYATEILETGNSDKVIASFTTVTPFTPICTGETLTLLGMPYVDRDTFWNGVKLIVEKVEHGIWTGDEEVTQKTLIWGRVI